MREELVRVSVRWKERTATEEDAAAEVSAGLRAPTTRSWSSSSASLRTCSDPASVVPRQAKPYSAI